MHGWPQCQVPDFPAQQRDRQTAPPSRGGGCRIARPEEEDSADDQCGHLFLHAVRRGLITGASSVQGPDGERGPRKGEGGRRAVTAARAVTASRAAGLAVHGPGASCSLLQGRPQASPWRVLWETSGNAWCSPPLPSSHRSLRLLTRQEPRRWPRLEAANAWRCCRCVEAGPVVGVHVWVPPRPPSAHAVGRLLRDDGHRLRAWHLCSEMPQPLRPAGSVVAKLLMCLLVPSRVVRAPEAFSQRGCR